MTVACHHSNMLKKYFTVLEQRLDEAEFTAYKQEARIAELEEQLRRSTDSGHDGEGEGEGEGPVRQEVRALREEVARRGMRRADAPALEGAAPSPPVVASLTEQCQMTAELELQVR
jgi:hypothetical protein